VNDGVVDHANKVDLHSLRLSKEYGQTLSVPFMFIVDSRIVIACRVSLRYRLVTHGPYFQGWILRRGHIIPDNKFRHIGTMRCCYCIALRLILTP